MMLEMPAASLIADELPGLKENAPQPEEHYVASG